MALQHLLPEIALAVLGAVLLLLESFSGRDLRRLLTGLTVVGAAVAAALAFVGRGTGTGTEYLSGFVLRDGAAVYARVLFCAILALVALLLHDYSATCKVKLGEMLVILTLATIGLMQMAGSGDILGIYLGLELVSISSYLLAGMLRGSGKSIEAAVKYFLMGAFASAVLLFGISFIYGVTGQTNLGDIARSISGLGESSQYFPLLLVGSLMLLGGFFFKVSAAPFHMWAPDTYEGAPTPVTAFLSVGPKAAAFVALLRISAVALPGLREEWLTLVAIIAVVTMFVGNLTALHQTDLKRLFAYSSIAQAGYILAAFAAHQVEATSAVLLYVSVYTLMNLGAFAIVTVVELGKGTTSLDGLRGLSRSAPWLAGAMVIFVISLIGIPPTGGMFAKLFVIGGLVNAGQIWLAVAIILNTVISVPYYYGIVKAMYLEPEHASEPVAIPNALPLPQAQASRLPVPVGLGAVIIIAAFGVMAWGVLPEQGIQAVKHATIAAASPAASPAAATR